ncbi:MAG: SprT family zinc-dependent metalloprotease [Eubacteriales bacterium]|nr:SprT family zinc-dependent metalloprotease [Eubacteriales bacterium]
MGEMKINGIPVTVDRRNIKSLNLYVKPPDGKVRVSAPMRTGDRTIRAFVQSHVDWIQKQQENMRASFPQHKYVTGETVLVFGEQVPLFVIDATSKRTCGARLEERRLVLTVPAESTVEQREKLLRSWQREQLKEIADGMLQRWAKLMYVQVNEWHIKRMKTKWGSCNFHAHRIWLNLALAEQPVECVEYVVVHELCHLLEPSHSTRFWNLMTQYLPDWKERRTRLNTRPGKTKAEP